MIENLETLVALSKEGTMMEASTALKISQSAVSQSIRQLEQFVGTALLDRSSRPMGLTEEGEALHHFAKEPRFRGKHEEVQRNAKREQETRC